MNTAPADLLILPMTEDLSHAIALATYLRSWNLQVQIYAEPKKFKQKMAYANKLGFPYVAILGEDEIKQEKVALKDMRTGEQQLLTAKEVQGELFCHTDVKDGTKPIRDQGEQTPPSEGQN